MEEGNRFLQPGFSSSSKWPPSLHLIMLCARCHRQPVIFMLQCRHHFVCHTCTVDGEYCTFCTPQPGLRRLSESLMSPLNSPEFIAPPAYPLGVIRHPILPLRAMERLMQPLVVPSKMPPPGAVWSSFRPRGAVGNPPRSPEVVWSRFRPPGVVRSPVRSPEDVRNAVQTPKSSGAE